MTLMNRTGRFMTPADVLLTLLLAAGTAASFQWIGGLAGSGGGVTVEVRGATVWKGALDAPAVYTAAGERGEVTVEVRNGEVAVIRADCPNHVCVRTGWRSRAGDVIVCVPNGVVVRIARRTPAGIEAVTG